MGLFGVEGKGREREEEGRGGEGRDGRFLPPIGESGSASVFSHSPQCFDVVR